MTTAHTEIATLNKTVAVPPDPAAAFEMFTRDMARWWPLATHSVGMEEATDVRCGLGVGEPILETMQNGDTASWGTITAWDPPSRLAFSWHPGSPEAEAGTVEVTFVAAERGTLVTLTHSGWENRPDGSEARAGYDSGWDLVLGRYQDRAVGQWA